MTSMLEEKVTAALHASASVVEPSDDAWAQIMGRATADEHRSTRWKWFLGVPGVGALAAASVAAFIVVNAGADHATEELRMTNGGVEVVLPTFAQAPAGMVPSSSLASEEQAELMNMFPSEHAVCLERAADDRCLNAAGFKYQYFSSPDKSRGVQLATAFNVYELSSEAMAALEDSAEERVIVNGRSVVLGAADPNEYSGVSWFAVWDNVDEDVVAYLSAFGEFSRAEILDVLDEIEVRPVEFEIRGTAVTRQVDTLDMYAPIVFGQGSETCLEPLMGVMMLMQPGCGPHDQAFLATVLALQDLDDEDERQLVRAMGLAPASAKSVIVSDNGVQREAKLLPNPLDEKTVVFTVEWAKAPTEELSSVFDVKVLGSDGTVLDEFRTRGEAHEAVHGFGARLVGSPIELPFTNSAGEFLRIQRLERGVHVVNRRSSFGYELESILALTDEAVLLEHTEIMDPDPNLRTVVLIGLVPTDAERVEFVLDGNVYTGYIEPTELWSGWRAFAIGADGVSPSGMAKGELVAYDSSDGEISRSEERIFVR